ncbi:hypothetical protein OHS81_37015 [Streptomyces sp. NBC_00400]|uniref:hypothetical protein n=1 Tax=Streptomyces sp. NBC_00400 TaxID=2975737 RepID=UPI002E205695
MPSKRRPTRRHHPLTGTAYIPRPEWGPAAGQVAPPAAVDLVADDVIDLAHTLGAPGRTRP